MLQSKFAKKNKQFQAQKIFTDRVEPRAVFRTSVAMIEDKPSEIINYYGKGGIGKTRLLKSIQTESETIYKELGTKNVVNIFVSLDAYEYANPVNILMSIRNGVQGDCGLFDYALLQYCAKAKMTVNEIMSKNDVLSSPVMSILNEVISLGTSSALIPTSILSKCLGFIKDVRFKEKYKEEIAEIAGLNEFEIFERLPYYLGLCISFAREKGNTHVIFLDSYESVIVRTVSGTPSVGNEDWLKELFLSCECIRIVIASRDRIRWDKEDADWKEYLNQHLLCNLSDEDSRWFLAHVPVTEDEVVEAIVEQACGVPLYLDMCADIYESDKNDGEEFDISAIASSDKIIDRYIRHLTKKDKYSVKVLSMVRAFDKEFAIDLLARQNQPYNPEELQEFLEKSIILTIEETKGLYKVDESVMHHLHRQMDFDMKKSILGDMMETIRVRSEGSAYAYLAAVLEQIVKKPEYLCGLMGQMLECVDYYANAGYWNELHTALIGGLESDDKYLLTLTVFEEIIYQRRIGNLKEAYELSVREDVDKDAMGVWYFMYRYLCIQIRHLQGYYNESLAAYRSLLEEMKLIKATIPTHIYNMVAMKYADLLFLKGRFDESMQEVEYLLSLPDTSTVDSVELFRIKGHIYRFNKQYDKAKVIYKASLKLVEDNGLIAYKGKLYNNMTEVNCMLDPEAAISWYDKSIEENGKTGNDIEIGKSQAAVSAAYTNLGRYDDAIRMATYAVATAEKTGYKSGKAFGLAALYWAYSKNKDEQLATSTKSELEKLISEISVYEYILEDIR